MTEVTQDNLIDIRNNTSANQKRKQKNCCNQPNSLTCPISFKRTNATKPSFNKEFSARHYIEQIGGIKSFIRFLFKLKSISPKIYQKSRHSTQSTYAACVLKNEAN